MNDSDMLCIFFSGYGDTNKEEAIFEWKKSTKNLPINKIFMLDEKREWYHNCIDEAMGYLKPRIEGKKAVTFGVSMGGYAAILFGHLLGCGSVSFGSQTSLTNDKNIKLKIGWSKKVAGIKGWTKYPQYLDLKFIEGKQHHLYYSKDCEMDKGHAERMNVSLYPYPFDRHGLGAYLKKTGELPIIINKHINQMKGVNGEYK